MKVGFSTPNVAGAGPVAQSPILTPANAVSGNALNGSALSAPGVPTLPQTVAPNGAPTPPLSPTSPLSVASSGGSTPTAPAQPNALASGASFVPLADAPAAGIKASDRGLVKVALQTAASRPPAAQNTVLAALLAVKVAQAMPMIQQPVGSAGPVPAATLLPKYGSLPKDTVKPTSITQTTQRPVEIHNAVERPVSQLPPSLVQRLLGVSSAHKLTLPNPQGPHATVKTPENSLGKASVLPSTVQRGRDTAAGMSVQNDRTGTALKTGSVIVSTRSAANVNVMEAHSGRAAEMLGSDRRADAPIRPKAALMQGARLPKQPEQTQTQTPQAHSKPVTGYQGQQAGTLSRLPEMAMLTPSSKGHSETLGLKPFQTQTHQTGSMPLARHQGQHGTSWSGPPNLSTRSSSANARNDGIRYNAPSQGVMQSKPGGTMLSPEGLNMMARPNTVYAEGAAAGVRVEPEQARLLGLRAGETINAVVTQRQDGNVLLIGKQQLPLPDRMNLPSGQVSLLVRVISGQPVLALTDPALAAQVAAAHQRTDADGRFSRLLNHVGSFHLSRLLSPGQLPALAAQLGGSEMQRGLASLLLDSSKLDSSALRQMIQNMGLFGEHQASRNPAQVAPGLKSMMLALRALMQARQMETTSISGAIDEIEARQIDSLAQQTAGRSHYSWVIPFADQHPVFIELQHHDGSEGEGTGAQESWTVDLTVGLTETVSMAANARVSHEGVLMLRLWLPDPAFYRLAESGKGELESMLSGHGLTLGGLTIYPVARDAGSVNFGQQRMGVSIDA